MKNVPASPETTASTSELLAAIKSDNFDTVKAICTDEERYAQQMTNFKGVIDAAVQHDRTRMVDWLLQNELPDESVLNSLGGLGMFGFGMGFGMGMGMGRSDSNPKVTQAYFSAAAHGQIKLIKRLINQWGVELRTSDDEGNNAYMVAAKHGQWQMMSALLEIESVMSYHSNNNGDSALHLAAENGHLDVVQNILRASGHRINDKNRKTETALSKATQNGHLNIVQFLLNFGSLSTGRYSRNESANFPATPTLFLMAAEHNHLHIMQWLHDNKRVNLQDVDVDTSGNSLCTIAAGHGNVAMLQWLKEVGIDSQEANYNGLAPLDIALMQGQTDAANWMFAQGHTSPHLNDHLGNAVQTGNMALAQALLGRGAQITSDPQAQGMLFDQTILAGNTETLDWLIAHAAQPIAINVLASKAAASNPDILKHLITQHKANPNARNEEGTPLFLQAIAGQQFETARWLVANGANRHVKTRDNKSAAVLLHEAFEQMLDSFDYALKGLSREDVRKQQVEFVLEFIDTEQNLAKREELLMKVLPAIAKEGDLQRLQNLVVTQKPSVKVLNNCLGEAVALEHVEMIHWLLKPEVGAQINGVTEGATAAFAAAAEGHLGTLKLLIQYGADPYQECSDPDGDGLAGMNLFVLACATGQMEIAQFLLDNYQFDVNKVVHEGNTVLHLAAGNYELKSVKFLVEHGADISLLNDKGETCIGALDVMGFSLYEPDSKQDVEKYLTEHSEKLDGMVKGQLMASVRAYCVDPTVLKQIEEKLEACNGKAFAMHHIFTAEKISKLDSDELREFNKEMLPKRPLSASEQAAMANCTYFNAAQLKASLVPLYGKNNVLNDQMLFALNNEIQKLHMTNPHAFRLALPRMAAQPGYPQQGQQRPPQYHGYPQQGQQRPPQYHGFPQQGQQRPPQYHGYPQQGQGGVYHQYPPQQGQGYYQHPGQPQQPYPGYQQPRPRR